jgi:hypothetical protein
VAVAAAGGIALLIAAPTGTDFAAQHARALFAGQHPAAAVDFRWYGGALPAAYSVIAPYVEALLGVRLSGVLGATAASLLLARLLVRWRVRRPVWAAALAAAGMVVNLVSGRVAFAIGLAIGLAALSAVPPAGSRPGRWVIAVLLAAQTTLTSPIAALFLALAAVSWAWQHRAAGLLALATAVPMGVVALGFHEPGRMPFTWPVARPLLIAAAAIAVVCRGRPVRLAAAVYGLGVLLVFAVPGPIGSNVERLALLFTPAVLAAAAQAPRALLVAGVLVAGQWTARVPITDVGNAHQLAVERAASHRLVGILAGLRPMTGRVEVVPFLEHGEADIVAQSWPIARGWERQVDTVLAAPLYRHSLTAGGYHDWLRANAVQYVALGRHRHDWSASSELRILRAPPTWLTVVASSSEWTVWRVQDSQPLVSGAATLIVAGPARLVIDATSPGPVEVAARWSRWLTTTPGSCVKSGPRGDSVIVVVRRPGTVTLSSSYLAPFTGRHC